VQLLVSLLLVRLLKYVFGLPRPGTDELCLPYSPAPSCHAMPSGHTVEAVNQTLPLALGVKNVFFSLGMGLYAASIAFTRIYLGQHHAGDVLFGWLIGAWGGCLIYALWKKAV
jgi:undecaprenyl-diphosphatase